MKNALCPPYSTHTQPLRLPKPVLHQSALLPWIAPGALITLCPMSAPQNVDSSLARRPIPTPDPKSAPWPWGQLPVETVPKRVSLSSPGGLSVSTTTARTALRPCWSACKGREGAPWLSGSLTFATQSLPSTHLRPSISTSPLETVP